MHTATADSETAPEAARSTWGWRLPVPVATDPVGAAHALGERVKELNCLYGIAQLSESSPQSMDELLPQVVEILPPAWQYPEITHARITFRGRVYENRGFVRGSWRQTADIRVHGGAVGEVEIFYAEARPVMDEGPFLREERALIEGIAERVGAAAARIEAEAELQTINRQLRIEREALQESNAALRAVLARIEEEKREIHRDIQANVEKILLPILHSMWMALPASQRKYVELLRENLEDIASPFINTLSRQYASLTPAEIHICKMIRDGLRTKEIARLRGVSAATINRHREHIRGKLGLANSGVNLITYLQNTM